MRRRVVRFLVLLLLVIAASPLACGDGVCRASSDCSSSMSCSGPGGPFCFVTSGPACTEDADCDTGKVCHENLGSPGFVMARYCGTSCSEDSECGLTNTCDSGGHCQPRTCAQCPSYFSCATGTCLIPSCSDDDACPGGYCVNGACSGSLGVCEPSCG